MTDKVRDKVFGRGRLKQGARDALQSEASVSALHYVQRSPVFRNLIRRQDTAPVGVGIDDRAAANDAAGVKHGVAANVGLVGQQRAEFAQAGIKRLAIPS